jgi:hypothetical protein
LLKLVCNLGFKPLTIERIEQAVIGKKLTVDGLIIYLQSLRERKKISQTSINTAT